MHAKLRSTANYFRSLVLPFRLCSTSWLPWADYCQWSTVMRNTANGLELNKRQKRFSDFSQATLGARSEPFCIPCMPLITFSWALKSRNNTFGNVLEFKFQFFIALKFMKQLSNHIKWPDRKQFIGFSCRIKRRNYSCKEKSSGDRHMWCVQQFFNLPLILKLGTS